LRKPAHNADPGKTRKQANMLSGERRDRIEDYRKKSLSSTGEIPLIPVKTAL
jgi:hypothetical protein